MYRILVRLAALAPIVALLAACGVVPVPTPISGEPEAPATAPAGGPALSYDFRQGAQGWVAGFADYPLGQEQNWQLESGIRELPAGITPAGTGYYIAGNNHSDDLFMFLKRKLGATEGVRPNTTYRLHFKIVVASNAPSGCSGIGGAPGESVTLKAGASVIEPQAVDQDGTYQMNVDKGNQTAGGPAGAVVGDIANGIPCEQAGDTPPYVALTKEHSGENPVTSSAGGELWLLVGTDSGFEGTTALYYQRIEVTLLPK
jgi:hypothetical protein